MTLICSTQSHGVLGPWESNIQTSKRFVRLGLHPRGQSGEGGDGRERRQEQLYEVSGVTLDRE